jgi:hypothetical protein
MEGSLMASLQMGGSQILPWVQKGQGGHDLMGFVSKPQGMIQVQVHGHLITYKWMGLMIF